jgi:hypothetical protein
MKTYLVSFSLNNEKGLQIGNIVVDLEHNEKVNSQFIDELEKSLEEVYSTNVVVMSFTYLPDEDQEQSNETNTQ